MELPTTRDPRPAPSNAAALESAPLRAQDDAVTFERLFAELSPYVLRVLPRMGVSDADVDDVAQEVFLAVHRGLPSFEGRSKPRTWVYGICIRVCASYRRRAGRRREDPHAEPVPEGDPRTPEQALASRRALDALDSALRALPDVQRAAFVLFEIEQLPMREVAEAMGCSKFTAYARLYAARRRVTDALSAHHPGGHDVA